MTNGNQSSLPDVVNGAVGAFGANCMGYMNPGASGGGYISTMKLSVDKVDVRGLDFGAAGIVSYDRCEKDYAYIGQINMGTASSFCGVNGALWAITSPSLLPSQTGRSSRCSATRDPCTRQARRCPVKARFRCIRWRRCSTPPNDFSGAWTRCRRDPGQMVRAPDGTTYWTPTPTQVHDQLHQHLRNVTKSMVLCGQDQDVDCNFMGTDAWIADQDWSFRQSSWPPPVRPGCWTASSPGT